MAQTRSPSVAGVDEASEFLACVLALAAVIACVQRTLPSAVSRQWRARCLPSELEAWRKILFCQTMGDPWPTPGRGDFQTTPCASHLTGTSVSSATPVPFGPRKRGQFPALAGEARRSPAPSRQSKEESRNMVGSAEGG